MKVCLISLGCSKNLVDSEIMIGFLLKSGFNIKDDPEGADVVVVNTCAFIQDAKKEAIDLIFDLVELKKKKRIKKIIVAGCLPKRYKKELPGQIKEVDGFIGPGDINNISRLIKQVFQKRSLLISEQNLYLYKHSTPRFLLSPKHYAYVKIAEGCNNRCSYCVIPQIRGHYRSRPIKSIVAEVKQLTDAGVKEINLISQDSAFYGKDIYNNYSLSELLERLIKIDKLSWIRILYSHPRHFDRKFLKIIAASPKICNYVDLPIQHINDRILKSMNRKVTAYQIQKLISAIRKALPDVALRTSLIVGFPGETETEFKQLFDFVKKTEFDRLGVFTYSQEENTSAGILKNQIPEKEKQKRRNKIMKLQQKITDRKNQLFIGKELQILIDGADRKGFYFGRSQFDAPDVDGLVYITGKNIRPGQMIKAKITDSILYDLIGEKI
jgi:ribosomal protein S12 methylthiotransferase